jgi:predicted nucleotidyltransferase
MRSQAPPLLPIFRSDLQAQVLAALLLDDEPQLTSSELRERTGATPASLHRELSRLERAGLVEHDTVGRSNRYRAATSSPLHEPLRSLMQRTLGVEPLLRERLAAVPGVEAAAIFGSWAAGNAGEGSDVDLLVIGDVDRDELLAAVRSVEEITAREIDVTAYGREDFERRRATGSGFLKTVLRGPLTPLVGEIA